MKYSIRNKNVAVWNRILGQKYILIHAKQFCPINMVKLSLLTLSLKK